MRKTKLALVALALPLSLAACGSDDTVTERTTTTVTSDRSDVIPDRTVTTEREVRVDD